MIIVENREGVGNKLKKIVSALRRADVTDDRIEVRFAHHDLFSLTQTRAPKALEHPLYTWQLTLMDSDLQRGVLKDAVHLVQLSMGRMVIQKDSIDFQYNNIADFLKTIYLDYFSRIVFAAEILDPVAAFCRQHAIGDCIGMHIRSWNDDGARKTHLFDLTAFETIVETNRDKRFFVCSDDLDIVRRLKGKYGPQVIWFEKARLVHTSNDDSKQMFALALIDLLILSRTAAMVGSYQSTFAEVAWWLGGAGKPMTIPTTKVMNELNKAANKALLPPGSGALQP